MFEDEIKKYYDGQAPSQETKEALVEKVRAIRRKRAMIKMIIECGASLAACFMLACGINLYVRSGEPVPDIVGRNFASIFSEPSGYIIGGMLFAILLGFFMAKYIINTHDKK